MFLLFFLGNIFVIYMLYFWNTIYKYYISFILLIKYFHIYCEIYYQMYLKYFI